MEVGGIFPSREINRDNTNQWRYGERLFVEIIHITPEGEGTVRINGQNVSALLETSTQIGEKFWVKVGDSSPGNLVLIREPSIEQGSVLKQSSHLIERGVPFNHEISNLVKTFLDGNLAIMTSMLGTVQGIMSDELMVNLRKSIPEWGELSEENGATELIEFLRKLGLNYEQRILLMQKLNTPAKEVEKESLRDTIKYKLLQALQSQEGKDSEGNLTHLLKEITSQQLWYKTGSLDNAFVLLHIPLLNRGQLVPTQIAIESARKGSKMDEKNCRVAIQMETQQLGDVGVDAYFSQESLTVRILTRETQYLPGLLKEVIPYAKVEFAKLGFNLEKVEMGDLDENVEFLSFLKGSRRSGVDIQS
ncbi:MAG: hypothetical protein Q8912_00240 [Bacillota bacterium]|nr:hypothetical protein [Bacillota bacterium]